MNGGGTFEMLPMAARAGRGAMAIAVLGDDATIRSCRNRSYEQRYQQHGYAMHVMSLFASMDGRQPSAPTNFKRGEIQAG
jgi:hypothetical protein